MPSIEIKKGNTAFPLELVLTYKRNPVDLSNCKVKMVMKEGGKIKINSLVSVKDQVEDKGGVMYSWKEPDLNKSGEYEAEFHVEFPNNTKGVFPGDNDVFCISVLETLI